MAAHDPCTFDLDEPYCTTILHRYYEGWPPREIARSTGVPVETVKSRLKRAVDATIRVGLIILEGKAFRRLRECRVRPPGGRFGRDET